MLIHTTTRWWLLLVCLGSGFACGPSLSAQESSASLESAEPEDQTPALLCPEFIEPESRGIVKDKKLREISGIVPSHTYDGFWVHNDSGDKARLYGLTSTGSRSITVNIPSATALDWEDLSWGPGAQDGKGYLYIGDIGDNLHIRPFVTVYQISEPTLLQDSADTILVSRLKYPNGAPNAETLMVHPTTGDLFIVSKAPKGEAAQIYVARAPLTEDMNLEPFGTVPIHEQITGGEFNATGNMVVLRTYNAAYFMKYTPTGLVPFDTNPCRFTLEKELQGEAISWALNDAGVVTLSEGKSSTLWYYPRKTQ